MITAEKEKADSAFYYEVCLLRLLYNDNIFRYNQHRYRKS